MDDIKDCWPTSPLISIEPSLSHWDFKGEVKRDSTPKPWLEKLASDWQKEGCMLTTEACRKMLKGAWKATSSGRFNMLLWRIISRKLPIREKTSKWGEGSHLCPRCYAKTESLKHALWGCQAILPLWNKCSSMLEKIGVTERI